MSKIGRNQPCPCGSGTKAKRCCGVPRGPSPDQLAAAFLNVAARDWAPVLAGYSDEELDELLEEMYELPLIDLSLHATLPRLLPPALDRLGAAIAGRDEEAIALAIPAALAGVDTPVERERLARAVIALHDDGHRVECDTTAYAVLDLAEPGEDSYLLAAGLYHALRLHSGTGSTPAGLLVAAS